MICLSFILQQIIKKIMFGLLYDCILYVLCCRIVSWDVEIADNRLILCLREEITFARSYLEIVQHLFLIKRLFICTCNLVCLCIFLFAFARSVFEFSGLYLHLSYIYLHFSDLYLHLSDLYLHLSDLYLHLSDLYLHLSDFYLHLSDLISNLLNMCLVVWGRAGEHCQ